MITKVSTGPSGREEAYMVWLVVVVCTMTTPWCAPGSDDGFSKSNSSKISTCGPLYSHRPVSGLKAGVSPLGGWGNEAYPNRCSSSTWYLSTNTDSGNISIRATWHRSSEASRPRAESVMSVRISRWNPFLSSDR